MFEQIISSEDILRNEPMKSHTTFGVGGPVDYLVYPKTVQQLQALIAACREKKINYFILGRGSNLLVGDGGYRGVIISLTKYFDTISVEGTRVRALAGASLPSLSRAALQNGLEGLAFAAGIPGTVGGAVVMNAGAYGGEIKQVIVEAQVLTKDGEVKTLSSEELDLGYRHSCILEKEYIVLSATFELKYGQKEQIGEQMRYYNEQRRLKQPLDKGSAGSTFKRPEGYFAGKLIQDAGLRGFTIGGAAVSQKHCGFVVNLGNATASDVMNVCRSVQQKVKEQFGVSLEMEVRTLGEF